MKNQPYRQDVSSEDDKWTERLRKFIILLLLLIGLILVWIFLPQSYQADSFQEIPINFHSVKEGNYHADPTRYWNPAANLSILKDIITELEPESGNVEQRVDQVIVTLSAPVPTAQPQSTEAGITKTTVPGNPSPTSRFTSTFASIFTVTLNPTGSPTLAETQTTPTETPQIPNTPTQTQTSSAAPTLTLTYTTIPSATDSPTNTSTPTMTPAPTKTKKHTPIPTHTDKPTQTSINTPTFIPNIFKTPTSPHQKQQSAAWEYLRRVSFYLIQQMGLFLQLP